MTNLASDSQVSFHVHATGQPGGVRPFIQNGPYQMILGQASDTALPSAPGWFTITWQIPSTCAMHAIGLQVTNPNASTTFTLAIDDLTW